MRFALIYAGLFLLSALALVMLLWWSTAGLLKRETDAAINADTQGLHETYNQGGVPALRAIIEQRIDANVDDDAVYLLVDGGMQGLAGNLDHWPERVHPDDGWALLPIERAGVLPPSADGLFVAGELAADLPRSWLSAVRSGQRAGQAASARLPSLARSAGT